MSTRPTIIVLLIAAVGVMAAWYTHHRSGSGTRRVVEQRLLLPDDRLPVDDVDGVTLSAGGKTLEFERRLDDETWWQTTPFRHPMDPFSIRQIIVLASQLRVTDVIEPGELTGGLSASDLMVEPPVGTLTYRWPDGTLSLDLGRQGIAGQAYLRIEGDQNVYVVGQPLHDRVLEMDPKEWRDRRLFETASVESDRIEIFDGATTMMLVRDRKQWGIESPVRTRLDPIALDDLVQALGRVVSGGFILDQPDDVSQFGLLTPAGTVAVTTTRLSQSTQGIVRAPVTEQLVVGSTIGGSQDRFALVEGRPTVVRLGAEALVALFRPTAQMVDPTASGVDKADVKRVDIVLDGAELRLERELEQWIAPELGRIEVPAPWVEELLDQLTTLRAPKISLQPYPRDLEVATITLRGFDLRPIDTVRIARDPADNEWALENGDDVLRQFPASMQLRLTAEDFGL